MIELLPFSLQSSLKNSENCTSKDTRYDQDFVLLLNSNIFRSLLDFYFLKEIFETKKPKTQIARHKTVLISEMFRISDQKACVTGIYRRQIKCKSFLVKSMFL